MINIVIIGQNEGASIEKMLESLQHINASRIWVLDRCTDNSEIQLQQSGERYIKTSSKLQGRQTSLVRNLGLTATNPFSDILFLDGDRYVKTGTLEQLIHWDKDIALLKLERDHRDFIADYKEVYGRIHNAFYSCGLFIKRDAINKVLGFQKELFSTGVQKHWGVEDTYLGDVCACLGLTADIYPYCRLNGEFENKTVSFDAITMRMDRRAKLKGLRK